MPVFTYTAMSASGQEVKDEIEAETKETRSPRSRGKKLFATKIRKKQLRRAPKKRAAEVEVLTPKRKMPISIGGVPRKQLVASPGSCPPCRTPGCRFCGRCRFSSSSKSRDCSRRSSAASPTRSKAAEPCPTRWRNTPRRSTSSTSNMINAGELGGVLDHHPVSRLADFMEKAAKLKKKVIGAMIYPAVVISIAVGIVSMIMIFVIPKFDPDLRRTFIGRTARR